MNIAILTDPFQHVSERLVVDVVIDQRHYSDVVADVIFEGFSQGLADALVDGIVL
jgi:hypothetical protein